MIPHGIDPTNIYSFTLVTLILLRPPYKPTSSELFSRTKTRFRQEKLRPANLVRPEAIGRLGT